MRSVQQQILHELEVHTAIEEEILYPEAEAIGGEAEDLVKDGEEEHHVVDVLMEEISGSRPTTRPSLPKMTVLIEDVEHHAEEEETELLPKLRETFGGDRLRTMGAAVDEGRNFAEPGSTKHAAELTGQQHRRSAHGRQPIGRAQQQRLPRRADLPDHGGCDDGRILDRQELRPVQRLSTVGNPRCDHEVRHQLHHREQRGEQQHRYRQAAPRNADEGNDPLPCLIARKGTHAVIVEDRQPQDQHEQHHPGDAGHGLSGHTGPLCAPELTDGALRRCHERDAGNHSDRVGAVHRGGAVPRGRRSQSASV
jgi:hypothetical protein